MILRLVLAVCLALSLGSLCGGGGAGSGGDTDSGCTGSCPQQVLSQSEAEGVVARAVAQAGAAGVAATIAVVDRVGNVLAVFQMNGAATDTTISSGIVAGGSETGLEGIVVPSAVAAISKAGTAAYLSSQGNAFTSRTASQIVQEHFNPHETGQPGGPLFGVQFSQLPCGDLVRSFGVDATGPKRLPLGLSADPGGLALYEEGVPVGGVGVELDGSYSIDRDVLDDDSDLEERIAVAAIQGFTPASDRIASRINVDGRSLRYADDTGTANVAVDAYGDIDGGVEGSLIDVSGFFTAAGGVLAGTEFLTNASGVAATTFEGIPAEVLVDTAGMPFPTTNPRDSLSPLPGGGGLTSGEVRVILKHALDIARRTRAQIRRPPESAARVNVAVVDTAGNLLGFVRSPDAPVFGIDVSLQKARTAAFFSGVTAGANLSAAPAPPAALGADPLGDYVTAVQAFVGPTALADGFAFSDRAGGNLSRPFFPDGIDANSNGPFSRPEGEWSPFTTGLQLDLVLNQLAAAICEYVPAVEAAFFGGGCPATPTSCAEAPNATALANGIQIFPGSVPIYRGATLVGGIGVSGDGIDQDDLVAFRGLHDAGIELATGVGNAPIGIRADQLTGATGDALRYVSCPVAPFLDSSTQDACGGL